MNCKKPKYYSFYKQDNTFIHYTTLNTSLQTYKPSTIPFVLNIFFAIFKNECIKFQQLSVKISRSLTPLSFFNQEKYFPDFYSNILVLPQIENE